MDGIQNFILNNFYLNDFCPKLLIEIELQV
jgi:hypothetical protein